MRRGLLMGAAFWLVVTGVAAAAEEPKNMSAGMATGMENAFPVPYRSFQLQTVFRIEDRRQGRADIYHVEPELRWGAVSGGFFSLGTPLTVASETERETGTLRVRGFYALRPEVNGLPGAAVVVGAALPTGGNSSGFDLLLRGILTKTAGRAQFNVNAEVNKLAGVPAENRQFRYRFGVGADVWTGTLIRTGLFVEQADGRGEPPRWRLQGGVFHHLSPALALAVGAEAGLSPTAPNYQVILGFQYTFPSPR